MHHASASTGVPVLYQYGPVRLNPKNAARARAARALASGDEKESVESSESIRAMSSKANEWLAAWHGGTALHVSYGAMYVLVSS